MKKDEIDKLVNKHWAMKEAEDADSDAEDQKKPFVEHGWFNLLVGLVITANAITIGLETDARIGRTGEPLQPIWYFLELGFCFLFTVELVLRFWFYGFGYFLIPLPKNHGLRIVSYLSGLFPRLRLENCMDFVIVAISILDTFILTPLGSGGGARFVSMLRFVRLMRLIRLVRLFKIFKELWLVASGLINAMKTLLWICVMITLLCYIGSIFATLWVGHNDQVYDGYFLKTGWDHEVYFSSVPRSMFTLFQVITLDQWNDSVARHVIRNQPGMILFFLALIGIATFGLLNIIVGVVVENTLATATKDERKARKAEEANRQLVFDQLREIFEDADVDKSGTLSYEEVATAIAKPEIYNKLRMIDFPVDDPEQIFELLDYDDSGELTIEEFIVGCLRMKGTAQAKDLLVAQVAVDTMKRHYVQFEKEQAILQSKLRRLDATARAIMDHGEHIFLDMQKYRARHPDERRGSIPRMNTIIMKESPWERDEEEWEAEQEADVQALEKHSGSPTGEVVPANVLRNRPPSGMLPWTPQLDDGQPAGNRPPSSNLRSIANNAEDRFRVGFDDYALAVPGSLNT